MVQTLFLIIFINQHQKLRYCETWQESFQVMNTSQINNRNRNNRSIDRKSLCNRIEPFPALFWALHSHKYCKRLPSPTAWHLSTVVLARYCMAGVSQVQFDGRSVAPNPFPLQLYLIYGSYSRFALKTTRGKVQAARIEPLYKSPHCPKLNLNLQEIPGCNGMHICSAWPRNQTFEYTVASDPNGTGSAFMPRFRLHFGTLQNPEIVNIICSRGEHIFA